MTASSLLALFGGLGGLVAGSFVGAMATRWPFGRSVAEGRSRCDACGHVLGVADLVPVASFVWLRGKCRACGAPISPVHLAAEIACALVGATAFGATAFGAAPPAIAIAGALFGWTLVALALLDLGHLWLPDRLTLPLAAFGIAVSAVRGGVPFRHSLIGAAAGYVSLALIAVAYRGYRGRVGMGGGDPKLFMAVGAWLGWAMLPFVLLLASLLGLASLVLRRARGETIDGGTRLPFGTLLALAAWPIWLVATTSWVP